MPGDTRANDAAANDGNFCTDGHSSRIATGDRGSPMKPVIGEVEALQEMPQLVYFSI
jgi:hypothetical protein